MTVDRQPSTVNVISQNVLYDVGRTRKKLVLPQDARIPSLAATLQAFPGRLDVVGIQEAYKSPSQHNGEALAEACGYGPGFWIEHNQKPYEESPTGRSDEHMGLFGALVDHAEPIELGDNRRAVLTVIADVAFVTLHLRSGRKARAARYEQAHELIRAISGYENAVVFGDFNEPPIRGVALARTELARAGFRSVFPLTGQKYPATCPILPYVPAMSRPNRLENRFVKRAWPIDDILIRGDRVRAVAAGVLERVIVKDEEIDKQYPDTVPREGSDHDGVWATLEMAA